MAINSLYKGKWTGWQTYTTNSDLQNKNELKTKFLDELPTEINTGFFFSIRNPDGIHGFPIYSKGICVLSTNDGVMIGFDYNYNLLCAFKSSGNWKETRSISFK